MGCCASTSVDSTTRAFKANDGPSKDIPDSTPRRALLRSPTPTTGDDLTPRISRPSPLRDVFAVSPSLPSVINDTSIKSPRIETYLTRQQPASLGDYWDRAGKCSPAAGNISPLLLPQPQPLPGAVADTVEDKHSDDNGLHEVKTLAFSGSGVTFAIPAH